MRKVVPCRVLFGGCSGVHGQILWSSVECCLGYALVSMDKYCVTNQYQSPGQEMKEVIWSALVFHPRHC